MRGEQRRCGASHIEQRSRSRRARIASAVATEISIETRVGQADKGTRGMPRRSEVKKDVDGCEKQRGSAKRELIR